MLDTGLLGKIAHPRPNREVADWLKKLLEDDALVVIPEIADYELRRNLVFEGLNKSIERLDQLKMVLIYLPINTQAMLKAAELWASARSEGKPTANPEALDGDVILAAQALQMDSIVATENVGHLALFIEAKNWKEIHLKTD